MSKAAAKSKARPRKAVEKFTWLGVEMSATHTRDWLGDGWSHIEMRVLRPKGRPVPITDTGYLSHFLDEADLKAAGGPVAFFRAWLDREADSKAYHKALARWQQLDLFA